MDDLIDILREKLEFTTYMRMLAEAHAATPSPPLIVAWMKKDDFDLMQQIGGPATFIVGLKTSDDDVPVTVGHITHRLDPVAIWRLMEARYGTARESMPKTSDAI